jgi:hypothetical protein
MTHAAKIAERRVESRSCAREYRSRAVAREFQREPPCASTGKTSGAFRAIGKITSCRSSVAAPTPFRMCNGRLWPRRRPRSDGNEGVALGKLRRSPALPGQHLCRWSRAAPQRVVMLQRGQRYARWVGSDLVADRLQRLNARRDPPPDRPARGHRPERRRPDREAKRRVRVPSGCGRGTGGRGAFPPLGALGPIRREGDPDRPLIRPL